jgi:glycosyltransferase involved in cell wall biosynthesis
LKTDKKIIHLSTSTTGGAAISAQKINRDLIKAGFDSRLLMLHNSGYKPLNGEYLLKRNARDLLIGKSNSLFESSLSKETVFSVFSASAGFKSLETIENLNSVVLHIHNWFNLVSINQIAEFIESGIKIVFTLHDQRLFTGGCHVTFQCRGFEKSCSNCPAILPVFKKLPESAHRKLKNIDFSSPNVTIIAPSDWMRHQAQRSSILRHSKVIRVPNPTDANLDLSQLDSISIRNGFTFGYAGFDNKSFIKGGDLIAELQCEIDGSDFSLIYLRDFEESSEFWKQLDYLIVPSRSDNSPNVMHEARRYGIPIIAPAIDGITELLMAKFDLVISISDSIFSQLNSFYLKNALCKLTSHRRLMIREFQPPTNLDFPSYVSFYKTIVN